MCLEILIFSIWPDLRSPRRRRWLVRPGDWAGCTRAGRADQLGGEDGPKKTESSSLILAEISRNTVLLFVEIVHTLLAPALVAYAIKNQRGASKISP